MNYLIQPVFAPMFVAQTFFAHGSGIGFGAGFGAGIGAGLILGFLLAKKAMRSDRTADLKPKPLTD